MECSLTPALRHKKQEKEAAKPVHVKWRSLLSEEPSRLINRGRGRVVLAGAA